MTRLTREHRYQIGANFQSDLSCARIGEHAKVSTSAVSRKIRTNGDPDAFRKHRAALRAGEEVPQGLYCAVAGLTTQPDAPLRETTREWGANRSI